MNLQGKLKNFDETNFPKILYEFGITSEEIKEFIIEQFFDYFENKERLEKNTIGNLTTTWFSFLSIQRDFEYSLIYISHILGIYNSAKRNNPKETFNAYAKWLPDFSQSITRFWTVYFGQKKIEELSDEDYLAELVQLIGQSIEGIAKPFLQFTLCLNRIKRKKNADISQIKNKDLGVIIDELINTSELNNALIFNNIRLNQWRNIAYHHNTKIVGGKMYYYLKRNNIIEDFEISRDELKLIARSILNIFKLIRIAETIFFVDNQAEIQKEINNSDTTEINLRKDAELLNLYNSINSQGFNIANLEYDETQAIMQLFDLERYSDIIKKAIHSSQFLYNLWVLTGSKTLKIDYHLYNGVKFFSSEILSNNFEKFSEQDVQFHELMKGVKFTYINRAIKQNINPFENLKLSDRINETQQFYSQKGDKISIHEFIKQFSLSVFCNFLALEAEGFKSIKINIGSDGSMVVSEVPTQIVLLVPAQIKNKALQLIIKEILNNMILFYEKNLLDLNIVNEAKSSNNYFDKIAKIKVQKNNQDLPNF